MKFGLFSWEKDDARIDAGEAARDAAEDTRRIIERLTGESCEDMGIDVDDWIDTE